NQTRIRQQADDIAASPFHHLLLTHALIDVYGEMPVQNDVQVRDRHPVPAQYLARGQPVNGAVAGKPFDLRFRRAAQRPMFRQALNECFHVYDPPSGSLKTRYLNSDGGYLFGLTFVNAKGLSERSPRLMFAVKVLSAGPSK